MQKILLGTIISLFMPISSYAALNCCTQDCGIGSGSTFSASCTNTSVCNCKNSTTTSNGVTTTTSREIYLWCEGDTKYARCDSSLPSYTCAADYYGTATSASSGCTACPANATCAGGNGSTFVCKAGYYKDGTSCKACESGATSPAGSTSHTACCYPSGSSFSNDGKGSGTYKNACCWSN